MTPKSMAEHWDKEFDKEFSKESDRASVIISEAMLEQVLETLLKAYLVPTDSSKDSLFDDAYAPIGNFSAKLTLCIGQALSAQDSAATFTSLEK